MSTDYATGSVAYRGFVPFGSPLAAAGDNVLPGSRIQSQYDFLVLAMVIAMQENVTTSQNTLRLQVSDDTGAANWTDIVAVPLTTSSHYMGSVFHVRVPENLAFISGMPSTDGLNTRRALQVVHSAGITDANVSYVVEVYTTSRHE